MEKKYITDSPDLIAEWNYEKNIDLNPSQLTIGSGKKAWWMCKNGHEWQATINNRSRGNGCPYCSGKVVMTGINDLKTINPMLANEWNYIKNGDLKPENFTANSGVKVWWICEKSHEWQAVIAGRNKGIGCPYCANKKIVQGFNDLATLNPNLANEWNYEKNGILRPEKIAVGSSKKVWWKCDKGHEWQATIANRNYANNCPYCANKKAFQGYNDLATINPTLANEWHYEKNSTLTPFDVLPSSHNKVWWKCKLGHEWESTIASRNAGVGCPFCSNKKVIQGYNDLATLNPILAREWNYEKNGELTPTNVTSGSNKKVWWKCDKGHEWQSIISNRNKGHGCPQCAGQKAIKGVNDLVALNPTLAKEWNYEKNNGLTPAEVSSGSDKKVWWICEKGHEYQAIVCNRNLGGGCPYCANKKVLVGYNDLATVNPALANEWNYDKNNGLTPMDFMPSSGKKVWWKCKKGHEWQATMNNRTNGYGCPICHSERNTSLPEYALIFYLRKYGIDVQHSYKEFGYELDIYIPAMKIAIEYDGSFWHKNRIKKDLEKNAKCKTDGIKLYRIREDLPSLNNSSIDYIVQKKQKNLQEVLGRVLSEITETTVDVDLERDSIEIESLREYTEKKISILVTNPSLATEWNYEKNGNLSPENLTAHSNKKVWWKCKNGHEWQAIINDRTRGNGCPYCSGLRLIKGKNDLQTINPILASEWNYEKNAELTPAQVFPNSNKKVWWKCKKGHEWEAKIQNRNNGRGCPYCSGRKKLDSK